MRKTRAALAGLTMTALAAMVLPGTAQAVETAAFSNCPPGDICFYTGFNGSGSMCNWDVDDPDWTSGNITCSWSQTKHVKSVFNNGYPDQYQDVAYFLASGQRIGCTKRGVKGNLAGTYHVKSHKWITKC